MLVNEELAIPGLHRFSDAACNLDGVLIGPVVKDEMGEIGAGA